VRYHNEGKLRLRCALAPLLPTFRKKPDYTQTNNLSQSQTTNRIDALSIQAQETIQSHRSPLRASKNWSYNRFSWGYAEKPQNQSNEQAQAHAYTKDKATYGIRRLYANAYNSKNQTKQTHEHDF